MDADVGAERSHSASGRRIVVAIVAAGAVLALVGLLMRGARGPGLPFKPGSIVLVTSEASRRGDDEPADPNVTRFSLAVAPSTELMANLGALFTGKMPRESGLVRDGDTLRRELPTLAEIVAAQGFETTAFVQLDPHGMERSGLARGFASVANVLGDRELAALAAEWLAGRRTAPSFLWLHARGGDAVDRLLALLHERGVDGHSVIVTAGPLAPAAGGRIGLTIRLPAPLLPRRVDPQPVSLVDVVASVTEAFGVLAPDGIGTPYLLHPDVREPPFVLSTRPLSGAFADADEVWLRTKGLEYADAPVSGGIEVDPALAADLRTLIAERFGYRFEEVERAELLRSQGVASGAAHAGDPLETRVPIARFGARPGGK